ncbi:MAG: hypothetical protein GWN00_21655 [Aliifodinibius sp.]|nr:hypothetical protein [Fodinibius sp.]NIY27313.1 hypothetical protein [Fodinibius sp.]
MPKRLYFRGDKRKRLDTQLNELVEIFMNRWKDADQRAGSHPNMNVFQRGKAEANLSAATMLNELIETHLKGR